MHWPLSLASSFRRASGRHPNRPDIAVCLVIEERLRVDGAGRNDEFTLGENV